MRNRKRTGGGSLAGMLAAALLLAGCDREAPDATPSAEPQAPRSILRPEVGEPAPDIPLDPLELTIGFPDGGIDLSPRAIEKLEEAVASTQFREGGPIMLGGHTDSGGRDDANVRASQARADAVRDWLVERGVPEERITTVAFGEQNPIAPNARPDGTPNERGRARNRRVELTIPVDAEDDEEAVLDDTGEVPTLVEQLSGLEEEAAQ